MFPLPMKYFLQFFALWPGHNNNFFFHFYALLSITSLIFQFYNVSDVFDNLELLSMNISNIIMILAIFLKTAISWRKRRYMKNVLIKMMDDWYQIKNPEQLIIMKNHVKFSHTFFVNAFIAYNFTILLFPIFALRIYFTESVENRLLPLLAKFPFSNKTSPIYEIIYILQAILLIFAGNAFVVLDTSYAAMILHAVSKLEIIRFELENFVNNILKSEKKSTVKVLFEKYHEVTKFVNRIDEIFSLQLFFYFILASLQLCFNIYINLMNFSVNNINTILKSTFISMCVLTELCIYCVLGEYLQSKSFLIAESVYFIPWYELKYSETKIIMMFIQRAQKPITITAGKMFTVSHFTFMNIIKTSVSYLSVLRAARV